jgi:hypothetical protein
MTLLTLLLLLLVTATPALLPVARRRILDPVLPVAAIATVLLALAAAVAATTDPAGGWRLATALVLGVAAATSGGGVVVRSVFRLMRRGFRPARTPVSVAGAADTADAEQSALGEHDPAETARLTAPAEPAEPDGHDTGEPETGLRGGAWIGYLERAAVAATLLAGWPEGVALVLAVKGVGRYSELREPNAPEAFIIGTLASMLWASAAAGVAQLLR